MLKSVRFNVFETNSSSTHSLTMVSKEDYDAWKSGTKLFKDGDFVTKEKAIEELSVDEWFKKYNPEFNFLTSSEDDIEDILRDNDYYTYNQFWDDKEEEYETDPYSLKYKLNERLNYVSFS